MISRTTLLAACTAALIAVVGVASAGPPTVEMDTPVVSSDAPRDRTAASAPLRLRAGEIDLRLTPSLVRANAAFAPGFRYVIQLDGPITPARRSALADAGVRLGAYVPVHAYLADLGGAPGSKLEALPFVTWVGLFKSEWKLGPELAGGRGRSDSRGVGVNGDGDGAALDPAAGQANLPRRVIVYPFPESDTGTWTAAVEQLGGTVEAITGPGVPRRAIVEIAEGAIAALAGLDSVMFVEPASQPQPRASSTNWIIQSNDAATQATPLWDAGLHGEGQIAGVIDWYMDPNHCAFSAPGKIVSYYGIGDPPPHPTGWHGTHVAGVFVGDPPADSNVNLTGIAHQSGIVFHHIPSQFSNNVFQLHTISHNDGARVHNNSWGGVTTAYDSWARDIDAFTGGFVQGVTFTPGNEEDLVLVATDNSGVVKNPDNAKNCISIAATHDAPNQHNRCFGSLGPTADGRRKPELLGPGCGSISANIGSGCGTASRGGTSFASPAISGLGLLIRQYFMEGFYPGGSANAPNAFVPSGALLKAMLMNSAVDMTGVAGYPSATEGWGRVLADDAVFLAGDARKLWVEDIYNADGMNTGESISYRITVADTMPLKITLVWTDVAAAVFSAFTPVNNLDLVVIAPDHSTYRGNLFAAGESTPCGAADELNNVEQVHLGAPLPGDYMIEIVAAEVNEFTQGFALVVTGDVSAGAPICGGVMRGDANGDGQVTVADAGAFAAALTAFDGTIDTTAECASDIASQCGSCTPDGHLDGYDIDGFLMLIFNGVCP